MKTKATAGKATVDEDEEEPKRIRTSRSKRRHTRRSSTESESPPRKRSTKSSKRTADKKSKRSKVTSSSSRRRRRSPSPSPSLSSSSASSVSRSCSTCSSSSSGRSVSPPPRSRSRDVKKRKGRGRDRERDPRRRKTRRSPSSSGASSSGRSRSRSKSRKQLAKDGTTRYKIEKDQDSRHASLSEKKVTDYFDRDEKSLVVAKNGKDNETESLEKIANETGDILADGGGSPGGEDLELILRQKALDNFRKFRAATAMAGKTDNGAARKETLVADITPSRRLASSLGVIHRTESPKPEDCGNFSTPWVQKCSAGMSHGAGSPSGILKDGNTGDLTQQEESRMEATHSTSQLRSPLDGRNSRSVMQRLVNTPGSASSVNQRLGSTAGVSRASGAPRIKSVVNIPTREGLDGSNTPQRPCAPVENSNEIRHAVIDTNKAEGTNGDDRKIGEVSASNDSTLSSADGKGQATEARIEDKDGSQFQKKTFARMHDGETVEVSYKVYIPKKTPALARRKLQR